MTQQETIAIEDQHTPPFFNKLPIGQSLVQDFNATILVDSDGMTNLETALGISKSREESKIVSSIILSEVDSEFNLFGDHQGISAFIVGLTRQEELKGSFEIKFDLDDLKASNWDDLKRNFRA